MQAWEKKKRNPVHLSNTYTFSIFNNKKQKTLQVQKKCVDPATSFFFSHCVILLAGEGGVGRVEEGWGKSQESQGGLRRLDEGEDRSIMPSVSACAVSRALPIRCVQVIIAVAATVKQRAKRAASRLCRRGKAKHLTRMSFQPFVYRLL